MTSLINYKVLKEIAQQEKERFAQKPDYCDKTKKYGDNKEYGFHLKPPFTKEELDACLLEKNINIPVSFYRYLTEVSRELVFGAYPVEIYLSVFPTREEKEKITLNDIDSIYSDFYNSWVEIEENTCDENKPYLDDIRNVMIDISHSGCSGWTVIYLGSGNLYGSVWYYDGSDDDYFVKRYKTFDDYLIYHMKQAFEENLRDFGKFKFA